MDTQRIAELGRSAETVFAHINAGELDDSTRATMARDQAEWFDLWCDAMKAGQQPPAFILTPMEASNG